LGEFYGNYFGNYFCGEYVETAKHIIIENRRFTLLTVKNESDNMALPPADFNAITALVAIGQRLITQRSLVRIQAPLPIEA
jgi:hypothetical protein